MAIAPEIWKDIAAILPISHDYKYMWQRFRCGSELLKLGCLSFWRIQRLDVILPPSCNQPKKTRQREADLHKSRQCPRLKSPYNSTVMSASSDGGFL